MALSMKIITLMLIVYIQIVESRSHGKIDTVPAIIDGTLVRKSEWPWIVSITAKYNSQTFTCGGSLIHRYWVVTACHCLYSNDNGTLLPIKSFRMLIGAVDIEGGRKEGFETTAAYSVSNPGFFMQAITKKNNDIALIKLAEPVPNKFNHKIKIGRNTTPQTGDRCMAMGWGCDHTSATPVTTSRLYNVILPVLPIEECAKKFTELVDGDPSTKICAGFFNKSMGICSGDSGGPLICREDRKWVLSGIISFTIAKCPGVFTRVSSYANWIISVIREDQQKTRASENMKRRNRIMAQYYQNRIAQIPTLFNAYPYYNFVLVRRPYPLLEMPIPMRV